MSLQKHAPDHAPFIAPYISRRELIKITGLSDTTLWRAVRRGDLPAPVRLSPGRVAWPALTITRWLAARAEAGR